MTYIEDSADYLDQFSGDKRLGALCTRVRGRGILGSPSKEPCITHPYQTRAGRHSPAEVPNPKPHKLWCCIKMRDLHAAIVDSL